VAATWAAPDLDAEGYCYVADRRNVPHGLMALR
jgi:hypothetical protein